MKRLCIVTTSPIIVEFFLLDHLRALRIRYDVTVVANVPDAGFLRPHGIGVAVQPLGIERRVAPFADACALWNLLRLFRQARFDAVVTLAPKAGLLGQLAARAAGVPFRCHVFMGEVWATRSGPVRLLLKSLDRLVARLATDLLVISASERDFLVHEGVADSARLRLVAKGSICGVNLERFRADATLRNAARAELKIPFSSRIVLFLGRLARDKGVLDLAEAFRRVAQDDAHAWLLFVGPDEEALAGDVLRIAGSHADRIRFVGLTACPERYVAAADVLALPSYREGFGNVIIEAAAAGVPTVASRIYGISDALVDGVTGLLHAPGDKRAIAEQLARLLGDAALRSRLGDAAFQRARRDFSAADATAFWLAFLEEALARRGG
jgi:glycosyltransferase involved in cell wall biosynthesis